VISGGECFRRVGRERFAIDLASLRISKAQGICVWSLVPPLWGNNGVDQKCCDMTTA
jgi:hypothetical protein